MKNFNKLLTLAVFLIFGFTSVFSQPPSRPPCPGSPGCSGANGGGGQDLLLCYWPPKGNIVNVGQEFRWLNPSSRIQTYNVSIFNKGANDPIHEESTSELGIWLDIPNLGLDTGNTYELEVKSVPAANDEEQISFTTSVDFTVRSRHDFHNLLLNMESNSAVQNASGVDEHLRKIDFLAQRDWNLQAANAYNFEVETKADFEKVRAHRLAFWKNVFNQN